jgi:hypothetical protein
VAAVSAFHLHTRRHDHDSALEQPSRLPLAEADRSSGATLCFLLCSLSLSFFADKYKFLREILQLLQKLDNLIISDLQLHCCSSTSSGACGLPRWLLLTQITITKSPSPSLEIKIRSRTCEFAKLQHFIIM